MRYRNGRPLFILVPSVVVGCTSILSSALDTGVAHVLDPEFGPCSIAMDSVRTTRGEPSQKLYSDTEDLDTDRLTVEHKWHYPVTGDSTVIVLFRWWSDGDECELEERSSGASFGPEVVSLLDVSN